VAAVSHLNPALASILAVDDNPQAMEILSQILLGFGSTKAAKCLCAGDAKTMLSRETFSLAIIDDEMPEEDGFALTQWIRLDPSTRNYTAPIIIATSNPAKSRVMKAIDSGANYVITKPIIPLVLLARMERMARSTRPFVTSDTYRGPDRRFHKQPLTPGIEERRLETLRLMEAPDRELSQDEINALF
jgi:CheY-like chemotaxis protein